MLCLLTVSAASAQNLQRKVKNAKGIEVIYQSSYKGKIRPGELMMTVSGNQVALESVWPEKEKETTAGNALEDKQPVIKSYIDYDSREAYKWAEFPDEISPQELLLSSAKDLLLPAKASIWD